MQRTTFTPAEIAYLTSQRLGRIATVDRNGAPRVVPTGFQANAEDHTIRCGGIDFAATHRYKDMQRNPQVAIVIDDLVSVDPWRARGIQIRGTARLHSAAESLGEFPFAGAWMEIVPTSIRSWGLDDE